VLAILADLASPERVIVVATHDDRVLALGTQVVNLGPPGTPHAPAPAEDNGPPTSA